MFFIVSPSSYFSTQEIYSIFLQQGLSVNRTSPKSIHIQVFILELQRGCVSSLFKYSRFVFFSGLLFDKTVYEVFRHFFSLLISISSFLPLALVSFSFLLAVLPLRDSPLTLLLPIYRILMHAVIVAVLNLHLFMYL